MGSSWSQYLVRGKISCAARTPAGERCRRRASASACRLRMTPPRPGSDRRDKPRRLAVVWLPNAKVVEGPYPGRVRFPCEGFNEKLREGKGAPFNFAPGSLALGWAGPETAP